MNLVLDKIDENYSEFNIEESEEIISASEIIKEFLLNKESVDMFSGVAATRGFFYQYFLFIYYCLECVESEEYDEVWYEIGDDITIAGKKTVEFIQVKTEKETVIDNRINTTDMTKRTSGLDSWIDKLFLQYEDFKKVPNRDISGIDITFKLCSNKRLAPGLHKKSINNKYQNTLNIEDVKRAIERKIILKENDCNGKVIEVEHELKQKLSQELEWYFEKSIFETFGNRAELESRICEKIEKIFNVQSKDLGIYCCKRFLVEALYLTADDANTSKEQRERFCFKKETISKVFYDLIKTYKKEMYHKMKEELIEETFNEVFIDIQDEINNSYKGKMKNIMINKLNWLANELKETADKNDKYVYERFINRIFVLQNGSQLLINHLKDKHYIKKTIRVLIYLLSVYDKHQIGLDKEVEMLINSCWDEKNKDLIIIANGREKAYDWEIKSEIESKSEKCKFARMYSSDIDCILIDFKRNKKIKSRFKSNNNINQYSRSDEEIKAIDIRINYVNSEIIEDLFDEIKGAEPTLDVYSQIMQDRRSYIYEEE